MTVLLQVLKKPAPLPGVVVLPTPIDGLLILGLFWELGPQPRTLTATPFLKLLGKKRGVFPEIHREDEGYILIQAMILFIKLAGDYLW